MKKFIITESEKKYILRLYNLNEEFSGTKHEGYDSMSDCLSELPYDVVTKAGLNWKEVRDSYGSSGSKEENLKLRDEFCNGWRPKDSKSETSNDNSEKEETSNDNSEKNDTEDKQKKGLSSGNKRVDNAIEKLISKYNLKITQDNIKKELDQEGTTMEDAGGVNSEAQNAVKKLISFCKSKHPEIGDLGIVSGYRSYEKQIANFGEKAESRGIVDTQKWNALPGFSQHHTGKAFDIFSTDTSWWNSRPEVESCVKENSKKYKLKVTYTKESTKGKLRGPEPWHLFYVG